MKETTVHTGLYSDSAFAAVRSWRASFVTAAKEAAASRYVSGKISFVSDMEVKREENGEVIINFYNNYFHEEETTRENFVSKMKSYALDNQSSDGFRKYLAKDKNLFIFDWLEYAVGNAKDFKMTELATEMIGFPRNPIKMEVLRQLSILQDAAKEAHSKRAEDLRNEEMAAHKAVIDEFSQKQEAEKARYKEELRALKEKFMKMGA